MNLNQLAILLRMKPSVDSMGNPIDLKRPIVFDKNGYEPHTELTMTATGHELGLPQKNALYNVPTIYNGEINNPDTFAGMNEIRKNVIQNPNLYKPYLNEKKAELRGDELRRAVLMKYMENL